MIDMTLTGKKTLKNKLQQNADQVQHFGIRKLSIGVTSVLLSTLFYVGAININTVQASTVDSGVQTAKVVQKKADSSVQAGLNKDKTDDVSGKAAEPTSQENDNTADNSVENHTENNLTVSKPESTIKARQLAESKVKNSNVQTQNGGIEQPSATAKPIEVQPNQDANANKAEIGQSQAEETNLS